MKNTAFRRTLAAVGSAMALLCSCPTSHAKPNTSSLSLKDKHPKISYIVGKWEKGSCSLAGNKLTYKGPDFQKTIELDTKVKNPWKLICSDQYTAILTPSVAVISLGGVPLSEGVEVFGELMGIVYPSNAYSINIKGPISEGIRKEDASIEDQELVLPTRPSRKWSIDMSNPAVWKIIND